MEDRELHKRIDSRRFPTIDGTARHRSRAVGRRRHSYRVSGDITFRGVSRQHEDQMTSRRSGRQDHPARGRIAFRHPGFGMEPPKVLMLKVEPEVEVRVEIFAVKDE
jgi:polyisoprenoid-binding protein YceI